MNGDPLEIPVRYNTPTRYDFAPYGALAKVIYEDCREELYIQVSSEPESSSWMTVGELLARTDCVDIHNLAEAIAYYSDHLELQKRSEREKHLL